MLYIIILYLLISHTVGIGWYLKVKIDSITIDLLLYYIFYLAECIEKSAHLYGSVFVYNLNIIVTSIILS